MSITRLRAAVLTAGASLALLVSGCSSGQPAPPPAATPASPTGATSEASQPTPAASTTSSPSAPSSPASSPAPSKKPEPPAPTAKARTSAQLGKALLSLKDIPPGFERDTSGASKEDGKLSSKKKECAPLVRLMNADKLPGSVANASVTYSGGQDGPFIDENLDALGTAPKAAAVINDYREAVKDCREVTITLPGAGTSALNVREISFAKIGDNSFAARFQAEQGPLAGFELIQVGTQSKDIVVGMGFVFTDPADAEAATDAAVAKVEDILGQGGAI